MMIDCRIELLRYPINSDNLHPVEFNWRCLAKKLLEHLERLQTVCIQHHEAAHWKYNKGYDCPICKEQLHIVNFNLPKAFKANDIKDIDIKIQSS